MEKDKVLLVLKPSKFRNQLLFRLKNAGFKVIISSNGYMALEIIKNNQIDKIVTQFYLPQFDGLELVLNIRDMGIEVPIIFIYSEKTNIDHEVIQAGASIALHAPVDPKIIIDLLENSITNIRTNNIKEE